MKFKQKAAWFLSGILAATLVTSLISPALALFTKTIQVNSGVNIYMDDKKLTPKDTNGNPVEVFLYNGTTYLPVRAISEALDVPVQWDGSTQSVYLGKHTGEKPAVWLAQLDYFYTNIENTRFFNSVTTDNLGNEHDHSTHIDDMSTATKKIVYKLNSQYTHLTGLYYQEYADRNRTATTTLIIYADGESIWKGTVGGGIDPIEISVNIAGASELKLEFIGHPDYVAIGELGLWT